MIRIRTGTEYSVTAGNPDPHTFVEIEYGHPNEDLHVKYREGVRCKLEVHSKTRGRLALLDDTRNNSAEMRRTFYDYTNMSVDQCKMALYEARANTAAPFHQPGHRVMIIKGQTVEIIHYCLDCSEVVEYCF